MAYPTSPRQIHPTHLHSYRTRAKNESNLTSIWIFVFAILGAFLSSGNQVIAQSKPDFGPNVYVIDPTMSSSSIEATLTSLSNEPQFSTNRYAVLFMPGTYNVEAPIGFYESIAGLGETPNDVTINGFITPNFGSDDPGANLTLTFWRSMENMAFNASTDTAQNAGANTLQWEFRRVRRCGGSRSTVHLS